jgi:hypothetical protein
MELSVQYVPTVREIAKRILKNKLGQGWKKNDKKK